jgi:two-component system LytT family response regulator
MTRADRLRVSAVIVDDEEPSRELMRALLGQWPDIDLVGEASNGHAAVELIAHEEPDLVFLDVQMPGMSGIDVAARLADDAAPLIVFVTAYDRYALDAFEVSACDYLLKPFDQRRLAVTMQRALARLRAHDDGGATRDAVRRLSAGNVEQVVVKVDGRHLFLDSREIEWIEAVGKDSRIHLADQSGAGSLLIRESLLSLERRLSPTAFLRVHRSSIVNRRYIRELQPWFKGDFVILLRHGARVVSGRTYRKVLQDLISVAPAAER